MKVIKWLIGGIGLASMGAFGGAAYLFQRTIKREDNVHKSTMPEDVLEIWEEHISIIKREVAWLNKQNTEALQIKTKDQLILQGTWLEAAKESKKVILLLHGYRSNGIGNFAPMAHFYHDLGYHVLLVDHRGHGKSEGEYVGFSVLDHKDCKGWIKRIIKKLGEDVQIWVHGISMGGATTVALCTEKLPGQVKGLIADCAFTSPWEVFEHVLNTEYHLPAFPTLHLADAICKRQAGYGFKDVDNKERVSHSKLPILFIHGDQDDFVPTWMSQKMYELCTSNKRLVIIKNAGHGESYFRDTETYQKAVKIFLNEIDEVVGEEN